MLSLSPRQHFCLRYQVDYCPWFGERHSFGTDSELSVVVGHTWTELYLRKAKQRLWSFVGVLPTSRYRRFTDEERMYRLMSFFDSLPTDNGQTNIGISVKDDKFKKNYPALAEFCWSNVLPDGQVRTPSSLTFFCEEGMWKVCLSERDRGLSLWGSGPTFEIALQTLEDRLTSGRPEWRRAKRQKAR